LTVLALGTFTAGIHIASWCICLVGVVLALGVPAIAWLEQSARNSRIHRPACSLHQRGQALTPMRFARSFEYETQSLLDQVLELATLQCRLRLCPAVEIVRDFDRGLHRAPFHKTINPYLRMARQNANPTR
jgi:hypothetical protein